MCRAGGSGEASAFCGATFPRLSSLRDHLADDHGLTAVRQERKEEFTSVEGVRSPPVPGGGVSYHERLALVGYQFHDAEQSPIINL